MNLEPLEAGREARWHTGNVHSHSITLHWAGQSLSFWACLPLCLLSAQAENGFPPRRSSLPREPQVPLPVAPQGPATLKHIYPWRPARADPES